MPSASTSTFRMPSASMSSLSQQMTVRSSIAAFSIGTSSSSRPSVITKPPTCWLRWRGKPMISSTSSMVCASRRSSGSRPSSTSRSRGRSPTAPAPDLARERRHGVAAEPHGGAHLADRPLAAVVDHRGADPRPLAAVAAVDVLDHLLAPLVLEVDVDVGRLVARLGHEALEDHGADLGADRGDAEREADQRVRRRAPPLAEDALGAGDSATTSLHGQEVGRVGLAGDQRELVRGLGAPRLGHARGIAPARAPRRSAAPAAPAGPRRPRSPWGTRSAARRARSGSPRRSRPARCTAASWPGEHPQHLGLRAQPPLGVGERGAADRVDADALADAGQHVDQPPARAVVHDRLGGGDEPQAELLGEPRQPRDARRRPGRRSAGSRPGARRGCAGRSPAPAAARREAPPGRRMQQQVHVRPERRRGPRRAAGTRPSPPGARPATAPGSQPAPGGAVARQRGQLRPLGQAEPRRRQQPRRPPAPSRAASRSSRCARTMPATELRSAMAKAGRPSSIARRGVFLRVAAPGQEGEVRGDGELGEGHGVVRGLHRASDPGAPRVPNPNSACYRPARPTAKEDIDEHHRDR